MNLIEKIREEAKQLNPIDDALFTVMAQDKSFCQEIIRTFLEEPDLIVLTNTPQKTFKNLEGRSIRVDLVCDIETGQTVNIEVEKNSLNHLKRVRYHSSILTTNLTDPGAEFNELPNIIIIYITKRDIFHLKQTKYYVDDVIRGFNKILNTGYERIFINGSIDDGTSIAKLMKVFTNDETYEETLFPVTSSLKYHYKKTDEGVNQMSAIIEKLFHEDLQKARQDGWEKGQKDGWEKGQKDGWEKGQKDGWEKGQKDGWEKGRLELLSSLINSGMLPNDTSRLTNISLSKID